jgi:prepilin-type processing-associated H-X9-DG protein
LVVIGIVATLMALLLPVVHKARSAALRITCASLMRGHGVALSTYATGHKGAYPNKMKSDQWYWRLPNDRNAGEYSALMTLGYMEGKERMCPASTYTRQQYDPAGAFGYEAIKTRPTWVGTYYYAGGGGPELDRNRSVFDYRIFRHMIRQPARYTMEFDWFAPDDCPTRRTKCDGDSRWNRDRMSNHDSWRDPAGGNVLWADGHVAWRKSAQWRVFHSGRLMRAPAGSNFVGGDWFFGYDGERYHATQAVKGNCCADEWAAFRRIFDGPIKY